MLKSVRTSTARWKVDRASSAVVSFTSVRFGAVEVRIRHIAALKRGAVDFGAGKVGAAQRARLKPCIPHRNAGEVTSLQIARV